MKCKKCNRKASKNRGICPDCLRCEDCFEHVCKQFIWKTKGCGIVFGPKMDRIDVDKLHICGEYYMLCLSCLNKMEKEKANLGFATNEELIEELKTRIEIHWDLGYRTVDGEK